jgi:hypothetical protein
MTFENEVLNLSQIMIPPVTSNVMSSKAIETKESGRPEKEDSEKSDKTLANSESMS